MIPSPSRQFSAGLFHHYFLSFLCIDFESTAFFKESFHMSALKVSFEWSVGGGEAGGGGGSVHRLPQSKTIIMQEKEK